MKAQALERRKSESKKGGADASAASADRAKPSCQLSPACTRPSQKRTMQNSKKRAPTFD